MTADTKINLLLGSIGGFFAGYFFYKFAQEAKKESATPYVAPPPEVSGAGAPPQLMAPREAVVMKKYFQHPKFGWGNWLVRG